MKNSKIFIMLLCALFAALSAVTAQIILPIGPVPISFTHVSIFIAAGLLGARYGTLSQLVYILLGAMGVPVFAGFMGGMGIITGPTGGFIVGYIGCAFVVGTLISRFGTSYKVLFPAMYAGWITSYAFGIPWLMHITGMNLTAALLSCVPFLPGDLLKTIISAVVINRLHPVVKNMIKK